MPWRPGNQRRDSLVLACCKDGLEARDRASDRLRWMKQKGALLSTRHFTDVLFLQLPWEVGSLPRPRGRIRVRVLKVTQPAPGLRCRVLLAPTPEPLTSALRGVGGVHRIARGGLGLL